MTTLSMPSFFITYFEKILNCIAWQSKKKVWPQLKYTNAKENQKIVQARYTRNTKGLFKSHCFHEFEIFCFHIVSFYNVKHGLSFIMSKSSSKNLSNENKRWSLCCLQDKTWIKMPILWKHRVCLLSLLRFFDELFDIINDDPFLTL